MTEGRANDVDDRLRETESRFRTMADRAPVLLWMAGTDSMCDFFNQVWLDFTGRTMEQEVGIGWAEGIHHEDFQRAVDTYLAAFNARREFKMVYRLRRFDGAFRFILDNGVPRFTPSGVFAGYIGSCIDITERVEAEHENARLVAELRDAVRTREDFISIASHELKTPLTSLLLQADRIRRSVEADGHSRVDPDRARRAADALFEQIRRLETLVDDMLVSSRGTRGLSVVRREELDLVALVRGAVSAFGPDAHAAGCTLTLVGDESARGHWDPVAIERVVVNLLSNAIKYAAGTPIVVRVDGSEERVVLRVSDGGRGIDPRDHDRVFGRFERASEHTDVSGMGLGLYIARGVTEAHGGSIRIESSLGRGSTFEVDLPRG